MNKRLDGDYLILYYFDDSGLSDKVLRRLVDNVVIEDDFLIKTILTKSTILKRILHKLKTVCNINIDVGEFVFLINGLIPEKEYMYVYVSFNEAVKVANHGLVNATAYLFQFDTYELYINGIYQNKQISIDDDYTNKEVERITSILVEHINSDGYKKLHDKSNVEIGVGNNTIDLKTKFIINYNVNGVPVNEMKSHEFINIDLTDFNLINELIKYELYVLDYNNIKVDNDIEITVNDISVTHKDETINKFKTLTDFNKYYGINDNLKENIK